MISTALFTAILLALATNALQSYNTQPQRQASYLSSQANHGQNNAPNAVVPASHPVAAAGPTYTRPGVCEFHFLRFSYKPLNSIASLCSLHHRITTLAIQGTHMGREDNSNRQVPQANKMQLFLAAKMAGWPQQTPVDGEVRPCQQVEWPQPITVARQTTVNRQITVNRAVRPCQQVESEWPKQILVNWEVRPCQQVLITTPAIQATHMER
jgi:hypothetical protein